jgi:hypothetical protein
VTNRRGRLTLRAQGEGGRVPSPGVSREGAFVSIVRVGLAETKGFGEGHDAIFGKKRAAKKGAAAKKAPARKAKPAAKGKKKAKKK